MKNLKNKTVFITGASAGIGKACALAFAEADADLLLAARRIERLHELAEALTGKYGIKVKPIKLDVRNHSEVKNTLSSLEDEWKDIDILINNAGLARGYNKIYEGKIDDWEEMIDTNIKGWMCWIKILKSALSILVWLKQNSVLFVFSVMKKKRVMYIKG